MRTKDNKFKETFTNLFITAVGVWALLNSSIGVGVWMILLSIGSGIHHWFRENWSRYLDYAGMYGVPISILLWQAGADPITNITVTSFFTLILLRLFGNSIAVMGSLVAGVLGLIWHEVGFIQAFYTLIAFGFLVVANQLGDSKQFAEYHGLIHGFIWHAGVAGLILTLLLIF